MQIKCVKCGALLNVPDAAAGSMLSCPKCNQKLEVPIVFSDAPGPAAPLPPVGPVPDSPLQYSVTEGHPLAGAAPSRKKAETDWQKIVTVALGVILVCVVGYAVYVATSKPADQVIEEDGGGEVEDTVEPSILDDLVNETGIGENGDGEPDDGTTGPDDTGPAASSGDLREKECEQLLRTFPGKNDPVELAGFAAKWFGTETARAALEKRRALLESYSYVVGSAHAGGAPAAGVEVALFIPSNLQAVRHELVESLVVKSGYAFDPNRASAIVSTDENGNFMCKGLGNALYGVFWRNPGDLAWYYGDGKSSNMMTVRAKKGLIGEIPPINVVDEAYKHTLLGPPCTITGRLRAGERINVDQADVILADGFGKSRGKYRLEYKRVARRWKTNRKGVFTFESLPPGEYYMFIRQPKAQDWFLLAEGGLPKVLKCTSGEKVSVPALDVLDCEKLLCTSCRIEPPETIETDEAITELVEYPAITFDGLADALDGSPVRVEGLLDRRSTIADGEGGYYYVRELREKPDVLVADEYIAGLRHFAELLEEETVIAINDGEYLDRVRQLVELSDRLDGMRRIVVYGQFPDAAAAPVIPRGSDLIERVKDLVRTEVGNADRGAESQLEGATALKTYWAALADYVNAPGTLLFSYARGKVTAIPSGNVPESFLVEAIGTIEDK